MVEEIGLPVFRKVGVECSQYRNCLVLGTDRLVCIDFLHIDSKSFDSRYCQRERCAGRGGIVRRLNSGSSYLGLAPAPASSKGNIVIAGGREGSG